jgi:GTP-binding protein LepA
LPGFKIPSPMVFAGIFPTDADDFQTLRDALEKLSLEDAALIFEPENSAALGNGFRAGFLGLLHLEIITQRLEREFDLQITTTTPSVKIEIVKNSGDIFKISSPQDFPPAGEISEIREPWVRAEILCPSDFVGAAMDLIQKRRGIFKNLQHPSPDRAIISAEMPLANVIVDFHDSLKSATAGFASMNFEFLEFRAEDLVRLDILLAEKIAPAFSRIIHRSEAHFVGNSICKTLKENLPRENFAVKIQAAIGARVIARETLSAMRKDVTAKLYGGDVTRKNKLLQKQKKGKKKMAAMGTGKIAVPKEVFLKVLKGRE